MKIYTKTGDQGSTSLYGGKRISKGDLQIDTYGHLDELNVYVGYLRSIPELIDFQEGFNEIQDRIFSIGSYLASDFDKEQLFKPELKESDIDWLEHQIDKMDAELEPLKYFVLPGGSQTVSIIHLARVVCRKCERLTVTFYDAQTTELPEKYHVIKYLNRLSDYLFVLSRFVAKKQKVEEFLWIPRK
jgi:cob(I)alamin adenosyltransferase